MKAERKYILMLALVVAMTVSGQNYSIDPSHIVGEDKADVYIIDDDTQGPGSGGAREYRGGWSDEDQ